MKHGYSEQADNELTLAVKLFSFPVTYRNYSCKLDGDYELSLALRYKRVLLQLVIIRSVGI